MIADHDNLGTDEARFLKKKLVAQIWAQGAWIRPKMRFLTIFLGLDHSFFLKLDTTIAYNNV